MAQSAAVPGTLPPDSFPFEYFERHIYLDLDFNDTIPGQWIFDTGAVFIYPDSTQFAGYPFTSRAHRRFRGAGQDIVTLPVVLDTLRVTNGHLALESSLSPVMDLKKILGQKPSGVVGTLLLGDEAVEINYSGFFMRIADRCGLPPRGYSEIPLTIHESGILLFLLTICLQNGERFEGQFVYDTGSGGMVSINSPAAKKWRLKEKIGNSIEQYTRDMGVGGPSYINLFRAGKIYFGGYEVKMPLLDYSLEGFGISASDEFEGIAGNMLFEQFDHILDLADRKLYIKPGKLFGSRLQEVASGFHCIDRRDITGGFVVSSMDTGGAAEKAGVRIGDVVTHINGVAIGEKTYKYFIDLTSKPYTEYTLTIFRDGEFINVRVKNGGILLIDDDHREFNGIIRM